MFPYFRNKFRNTARENRIQASVRPRYCWTSSKHPRPPGRTTQKRIPGLQRACRLACRLWSHFVRHPPAAEMTLSGDNESADRLFQGAGSSVRFGSTDDHNLRLPHPCVASVGTTNPSSVRFLECGWCRGSCSSNPGSWQHRACPLPGTSRMGQSASPPAGSAYPNHILQSSCARLLCPSLGFFERY